MRNVSLKKMLNFQGSFPLRPFCQPSKPKDKDRYLVILSWKLPINSSYILHPWSCNKFMSRLAWTMFRDITVFCQSIPWAGDFVLKNATKDYAHCRSNLKSSYLVLEKATPQPEESNKLLRHNHEVDLNGEDWYIFCHLSLHLCRI